MLIISIFVIYSFYLIVHCNYLSVCYISLTGEIRLFINKIIQTFICGALNAIFICRICILKSVYHILLLQVVISYASIQQSAIKVF